MVNLTNKELAQKYRPLLVLYPEIKPRTKRRKNPRFPNEAPLFYDYHPRSIRFVLENAAIRGRREPKDFNKILSQMDRERTSNLDIVAGAGPLDKDRFWKRYANFVAKVAGKREYDLRGYAHICEGHSRYEGLMAITYWYAYIYNDSKLPHEMDWESVTVMLEMGQNAIEKPVACLYSAHFAGYRLRWKDAEKVNDDLERDQNGNHPVVYVANGSHANYFFGGQRYTIIAEKFGIRLEMRFPFMGEVYDYVESFDHGSKHLVDIEVIPPPPWTGEWRWLNFEGDWGSPGAPKPIVGRIIWNDPFRWIDYYCEEAPDAAWLERTKL